MRSSPADSTCTACNTVRARNQIPPVQLRDQQPQLRSHDSKRSDRRPLNGGRRQPDALKREVLLCARHGFVVTPSLLKIKPNGIGAYYQRFSPHDRNTRDQGNAKKHRIIFCDSQCREGGELEEVGGQRAGKGGLGKAQGAEGEGGWEREGVGEMVVGEATSLILCLR